jgi:hypothetical protein
MEHQAYRCCLPTLAGFAGNHCIGPDLRRRPTGRLPTPPPLRGIPPSYSGLLVQGTANSPPSTTKSFIDSKNWSGWSGSNFVWEFVALPIVCPTPSPCARNAGSSKILRFLAGFSCTPPLASIQPLSVTPSLQSGPTLSQNSQFGTCPRSLVTSNSCISLKFGCQSARVLIAVCGRPAV